MNDAEEENPRPSMAVATRSADPHHTGFPRAPGHLRCMAALYTRAVCADDRGAGRLMVVVVWVGTRRTPVRTAPAALALHLRSRTKSLCPYMSHQLYREVPRHNDPPPPPPPLRVTLCDTHVHDTTKPSVKGGLEEAQPTSLSALVSGASLAPCSAARICAVLAAAVRPNRPGRLCRHQL